MSDAIARYIRAQLVDLHRPAVEVADSEPIPELLPRHVWGLDRAEARAAKPDGVAVQVDASGEATALGSFRVPTAADTARSLRSLLRWGGRFTDGG